MRANEKERVIKFREKIVRTFLEQWTRGNMQFQADRTTHGRLETQIKVLPSSSEVLCAGTRKCHLLV